MIVLVYYIRNLMHAYRQVEARQRLFDSTEIEQKRGFVQFEPIYSIRGSSDSNPIIKRNSP